MYYRLKVISPQIIYYKGENSHFTLDKPGKPTLAE